MRDEQNEQLELFSLDIDTIEEIKPPKPKRGKKHRSVETFNGLVIGMTYDQKAIFCSKEWTKSVAWENFRAEVLKTKQSVCEVCPSGIKKLTLHHMRYDNVTHETYERDIMVMCGGCHYIFERHRKSLDYPRLREEYATTIIIRILDPDDVTASLREINDLMNKGDIGWNMIVDEDFDHHKTIDDVISNFRSAPFSYGVNRGYNV